MKGTARVLFATTLLLASSILTLPSERGNEWAEQVSAAEEATASAMPISLLDAVMAQVPDAPRATVQRLLAGIPQDAPLDEVLGALRLALPTAAPPPVLGGGELPEAFAAANPEPPLPVLVNHWDFEGPSADGWTTQRPIVSFASAWERGNPTTGPATAQYTLQTGAKRWVDASDGTQIAADGVPFQFPDKPGTGPQYPIPFPFQFYGLPVASLLPTTDGGIRLGATGGTARLGTQKCMWDVASPSMGDAIAVLWDRIESSEREANSLVPPGTVWYKLGGEVGNEFAVVMWQGYGPVGVARDARTYDFEAILARDGRIILQYGDEPPMDPVATKSVHDAVVGLNAFGGKGYDAFCMDFARLNTSRAYIFQPTTPQAAHSGSFAWATKLAANYPKDTFDSLVSPPLDLRGVGEASLSFWSWYKFNRNFDGAIIQVTADGGATWTEVTPKGGYSPGTCDLDQHWATLLRLSRSCWTGQSDWREERIDLSPFAGSVVKVRFLAYDSFRDNKQDPGWYIDDVELRVGLPVEQDLQVADVLVPARTYLGDESTVTFTVRNRGGSPVEGATLNWDATVDGFQTESGTLDVPRVEAGTTIDLTTPWRPIASRGHLIHAKVVNPGDPNPLNDEGSRTASVVLRYRAESFEAGPNWTSTGLPVDDWQWGIPEYGPSGAFDGTMVWGTNLTGPYANATQRFLVSPPLFVPSAFNTIGFRFAMWLDQGINAGARVEATQDGGATWHLLEPREGPWWGDSCDVPGLTPDDAAKCWPFNRATALKKWTRFEVGLEAFKGKAIQLRFNVWTGPFVGEAAGVYVDDFSIEGEAITRDAAAHAILEPPVTLIGPGEDLDIVAQFGNEGFLALDELPAEILFDGVPETTTFYDVAPEQRVSLRATYTVPATENVAYTIMARTTAGGDDRPGNDVAAAKIVFARSVYDIRVSTPVTSHYFEDISTPLVFPLEFHNTGTRTLPELQARIRFERVNGTVAHEFLLPIGTLAPLSSASVPATWTPQAVGQYRIDVEVPLANDPSPDDNRLVRRLFYGVPSHLLHDSFENATQGWEAQSRVVRSTPMWERGTPAMLGPGARTYEIVEIPFNWFEASLVPNSRTSVAGDEAAGIYRLNGASGQKPKTYNFHFFNDGIGVGEIGYNTNGLVMIGPLSKNPVNTCQVPDSPGLTGYIAPFWDDLTVPVDPNKGGIYIAPDVTRRGPDGQSLGATVIEWKNATVKGTDQRVSFEITLIEDGSIVIQYDHGLPNGTRATAAIQDFNGRNGRLFACRDWNPEFIRAGTAYLLQPVPGPPAATSPPGVWATNLAGRYPPNLRERLVSPPLDLAGAAQPLLEFQQYYETEQGQDGGRILASTDGGGNWTALTPLTPAYSGSVAAFSDAPGYSGAQRSWQKVRFSLAGFQSPRTQISFEFAADAETEYAGWYIDDVRIIDGTRLIFQDAASGATPGLRVDFPLNWARGIPAGVIPRAGSDAYAWATNLTGTYAAGVVQELRTPAVDIRQSLNPILSFWWYVDTEVGQDDVRIELRPNALTPWMALRDPESGSLGWRYEEVDLRAFHPQMVGEAFQVQWQLAASPYNQRRGVLVDDISISDALLRWQSIPPRFPSVDATLYTFQMNLSNAGPDSDDVTLYGRNAANPDWPVTFSPDRLRLAPGERAPVLVKIQTPTGGRPGKNTVTVEARSGLDPFRSAFAPIVTDLVPAPRPDLRVLAINVADSFLDGAQATVWTKAATRVAVEVENTGLAPGAGFDVYLYERLGAKGQFLPIGSKLVPTVPVGGQRTAEFLWVPRGAGPQTLRAVVDPIGLRPEQDRRNNEATLTLSVREGLHQDPRVQGLTLTPSAPRPGEPVRVSFQVINEGSEPIRVPLRYEALSGYDDGLMTSPPMPVSSGRRTLQFWTNFDLETGVDGVTLEARFGAGWRRVPVAGPTGQPASMSGFDSITGSSDGEWRHVAIAFPEADAPLQFRFRSRLDATNVGLAKGILIDGLNWTTDNGEVLWSEDFEQDSLAGWQVTGVFERLNETRAPEGFQATAAGMTAGGEAVAGFGHFNGKDGYGRLFTRSANGTCPARACLVGVGSVPPMNASQSHVVEFDWVPKPQEGRSLVVRLDPKGTSSTHGTLPSEAAKGLRNATLAPEWSWIASEVLQSGKKGNVTLRLTNTAPDEMKPKLQVLSPAGWQVTVAGPIAASGYKLAPAAYVDVTLVVNAPATATTGTHELTLLLNDTAALGRLHRDGVAILLSPIENAGMTPWSVDAPSSAAQKGPGFTLVKVTNGPGQPQDVTAGIAVTTPGIRARIEPQRVHLDPGRDATFKVTILANPIEPLQKGNLTLWFHDGARERRLNVSVDPPPVSNIDFDARDVVEPDATKIKIPVRIQNSGNQAEFLLLRLQLGEDVHWHQLLIPAGAKQEISFDLNATVLGSRPEVPFTVHPLKGGVPQAPLVGVVRLPRAVPLDAAIDGIERASSEVAVRIVYGAPRSTGPGWLVAIDQKGATVWRQEVPPGDPGTTARYAFTSVQAARVELHANRTALLSAVEVPPSTTVKGQSRPEAHPAPSAGLPALFAVAVGLAMRRRWPESAVSPSANTGSRPRKGPGRSPMLTLAILAILLGPLQTGWRGPDAPLVAAASTPPEWAGPHLWDADADRVDDRILRSPSGVTGMLVAFEGESVSKNDLARLHAIPGLRILRPFELVPMVWVTAPVSTAMTLAQIPGVAFVHHDTPLRPTLDSASRSAKAREDLVNAYTGAWRATEFDGVRGLAGQKVSVAVVDGGIDDKHFSLNDFDGLFGTDVTGPKVRARLHAFFGLLQRPGEQPTSLFAGAVGTIDIPPPPAAPCEVSVAQPFCPGDASLTGEAQRRQGGAGNASGDPFAYVAPHATAMAGIVSGTGVSDPLIETTEAGIPGTETGIAPGTDLVDVHAYVPAGSGPDAADRSTGTQGVGVVVAALDLIARYNRLYPTTAIDIALLPLTSDELVAHDGSSLQDGQQDALTQAIDRLATYDASRNPLPVLTVVSAGSGHRDANGRAYLTSPATASLALTVGAVDTRGSTCRGDDVPVAASDSASWAQQGAGLRKPEIVAPGVGVPTAVAGTGLVYQPASGTSAAAAVAAGAAAIAFEHLEQILGRRPTPGEVRSRIVAATAAGTGSGWTPGWGFGYLDVAAVASAPFGQSDVVGVRLAATATTTGSEVPFAVVVEGHVAINDTKAHLKVRQRGPQNTCLGGPAGEDTTPPRVWSNADPVPDHDVVVTLAENVGGYPQPIGVARTNATGDFRVEVPIGADVAPSGYVLSAKVVPRSPSAISAGVGTDAVSWPLDVRDRPSLAVDACFPQPLLDCDPQKPVLNLDDDGPPRIVKVAATGASALPLTAHALTLRWNNQSRNMSTDAQGEALFELPLGKTPGTRTLVVESPPTPYLLANQTSVSVRIRHPTRIDWVDSGAGVVAATASSSLNLTAKLVDSISGAPIAGQSVALRLLGDRVIANSATDANGTARLAIPRTALPTGAFTLVLSFSGNDLHAASNALPLQVTAFGSALAAVTNVEADRNGTATIRGTVRSPSTSVAGLPLDLEWNGARLDHRTLQTGPDGDFLALVPIGVTERLGNVTFRIVFPGSPKLAAFSLTGTAFVRDQPRLALDPLIAARGQTTLVAGNLEDSAGQPLKGQTITVSWAGLPIGTTRTDDVGRFFLEYPVPTVARLGPSTVRVRFAATGPYYAVQETSQVSVIAHARLSTSQTELENGTLLVKGSVTDADGAPLPLGGDVILRLGEVLPESSGIRLEAPAILDLRDRRLPVLQLDHEYRLSNAEQPVAGARVLVAPEGTQLWEPLHYAPGAGPAASRPQDAAPIVGQSPGWRLERADLSSFAGQDIKLRWRMNTTASGADRGWFIDDVQVIGILSAAEKSLFQEDFEALAEWDDAGATPGWSQSSTKSGRGWRIGAPPSLHPDVDALQAEGAVAAVTPARIPAHNTSVQLYSPPIALPPGEDVYLSFAEWTDLGEGSGTVSATFDRGATWVAIPSPPRSSTIGWHPRLIDISAVRPLNGTDVQLRWTLESEGLPSQRFQTSSSSSPSSELRLMDVALDGEPFAYNTLELRSRVANVGGAPKNAEVRFRVENATGARVAETRTSVEVAIRGDVTVLFDWQPTEAGRYRVSVEVYADPAAVVPLITATSDVTVAGLGWFIHDVEAFAFQSLRRADFGADWTLDGFTKLPDGTIRSDPGAQQAVARWNVGTGASQPTHLRINHHFSPASGDSASTGARLTSQTASALQNLRPLAPRPPTEGAWQPAKWSPIELFPLGGGKEPTKSLAFVQDGGQPPPWNVAAADLGVVRVIECEPFDSAVVSDACGSHRWHAASLKQAARPSQWITGPLPHDLPQRLEGPLGTIAGIGFSGPYADEADDALQSPTINVGVKPGTLVELRFWHFLGIRPDGDEATVEVSNNGGKTWNPVRIATKSGTANAIFTSSPTAPRRDLFDLSAFAGQRVNVALELLTSGPTPLREWTVHGVTAKDQFQASAPWTSYDASNIGGWTQTPIGPAETVDAAALLVRQARPGGASGVKLSVIAGPNVLRVAKGVDGEFEFQVPLPGHGPEVPIILEYEGIASLVRGQRVHFVAEARPANGLDVHFLGSDNANGTIVLGHDVRFTGRLTARDGTPIPGARILLAGPGGQFLDLRTHAAGEFLGLFNAPTTMSLGPQTWRISTATSSLPDAILSTSDIQVTVKRATLIEAKARRAAAGFIIEGRLVDDRDRAVTDAAINATIGEFTKGTATDSRGAFAIAVPSESAGEQFTATLLYPGSETAAAVAVVLSVKTTDAGIGASWAFWPWVILPVGLGLILVFYRWVSRRRDPAASLSHDDPYRLGAGRGPRARLMRDYEAFVTGLAIVDENRLRQLTARELERLILARWKVDSESMLVVTQGFERARYATVAITAAEANEVTSKLRAIQREIEAKAEPAAEASA